MESLTRNNYEIWFLDYLDGQLDNGQLETLLDFLEQNPDLKQELSGVSGIRLAAGPESLDQKEQMLKGTDDIPGIASIDQLCIARMENDLTAEDAERFDRRLNEDGNLSRNYAAFMQTRLNPSDSVVYPYKKDLRKKTVIFTPWLITAISSAAVILLVWFLWPDSKDTAVPPMANIEKPAAANPSTPDAGKPQTTGIQLPETAHRELIAANRPAAKTKSARQKPSEVETPARQFVPMNSISRKQAVAGPRIPDPQNMKLLYASNDTGIMSKPVEHDERMTIPQYALQLFREKILGEDRIVVRKTRFSLWEVAGAGVSKINSLAGTKMKLNREYDAQGDILAVSFNSRLIDVESPIKGQGIR